MTPDSALFRLRTLLASVCPLDADLEALCLDTFPAVCQHFGSGMSYLQKLNVVLSQVPPETLLQTLTSRFPDRPEIHALSFKNINLTTTLDNQELQTSESVEPFPGADSLKKRLEIQENNLERLLERKAYYGMDAPLYVENQITLIEQQISELRTELARRRYS